MKSLIIFLICCTLAAAAETKQRTLTIGDWTILIPVEAEDQKTDGPDFSVTYITLSKFGAQLGIYEGGHPQEFAKTEKDVVKKKDKVGGQRISWSIWKSQTAGKDLICAESFMVCAVHTLEPGITYEEKFHIFLSAPDGQSLSALQDVVRTLKKKEPKQSSQPIPRPRNGSS